jgi:hypothetical protein
MAPSKEKNKSFSNTFLNGCKVSEAVKRGMSVSAAARACFTKQKERYQDRLSQCVLDESCDDIL